MHLTNNNIGVLAYFYKELELTIDDIMSYKNDCYFGNDGLFVQIDVVKYMYKYMGFSLEMKISYEFFECVKNNILLQLYIKHKLM